MHLSEIKYNLDFLLYSTSIVIILFFTLQHWCKKVWRQKKLESIALKKLTPIEKVEKF